MDYIDFILGKIKSGILQLITLGGLGIWTTIDLILIASQNFKDSNNRKIITNKKPYLTIIIIICIIIIIFNIIGLILGKLLLTYLELNPPEIIISDNLTIPNYDMQVFIYNEATKEEIINIEKSLKKINGIDKITYVSKEEAYNQMKEKLGNNSSLIDGIDTSIFSPSYIITLENISLNKEIENQINEIGNIKNITNTYSNEIYKRYYKTLTLIKILLISGIIIRMLYILTLIFICCISFKKINSHK